MKPNLFTPTRLHTLDLRNRFLRAGCFEGMCQDGKVTAALIEHHRRLAAGGVAMTTVAYCSVSYDGRAFGHEMWMRPEIVPDLKRLTDAVHVEGGAVSIQLGHCGFFSSPHEIGKRPMGASPRFCAFRLSVCRPMTNDDIQEKIHDFGAAARMAQEAGFDAVEIHAGHGYLLSQFLSPWTNRRSDSYGGSLENRLCFPLAVIRRVRKEVGADFPILVKMNQRDGFRGGLELNEALQIAHAFEQNGVNALVPSCGFTARTPLYMMRGHVPTREMAMGQERFLLRWGMLLFGWLMVQRYPFRPLFLLEGARKIRDAVNIPVGYVGGVLSRDNAERVLSEGFGFIELGRATVRHPDFVNRLQNGELSISDCDHCNRCIAAMSANGVYCVSEKEGFLN